jgi:hypothetical protein
MGLLDDAIREHLELQRRRGADPAEIERSEQEALGPVRRAPEELEPADFESHGEVEEVDEYEYEDDPEHEPAYPEDAPLSPHDYEAEPPEYEPGPTVHEPLAPEPPAYDEPRSYDEPSAYEEPPTDEEPTGYHEPPTPYPAHEVEAPGQETVEYELEEHLESGEHPAEERPQEAEPREGEDVLEETPEFLQDTPEHDRLWFEQRPPRDFDFDG